jgi:hypothetical protein
MWYNRVQWRTSRQYLRVSQFRFRAEKARFPCENLDFSGLNQKLRGSQIQRQVLQYCANCQHQAGRNSNFPNFTIVQHTQKKLATFAKKIYNFFF